jgi:hypothetical protein
MTHRAGAPSPEICPGCLAWRVQKPLVTGSLAEYASVWSYQNVDGYRMVRNERVWRIALWSPTSNEEKEAMSCTWQSGRWGSPFRGSPKKKAGRLLGKAGHLPRKMSYLPE